MSNKEKEEVLRRLERNRVAFEGWLAKKREERTRRKSMEQSYGEERMEYNHRRSLAKKAYAGWLKRKQEEDELAKQQRRVGREMQRLAIAKKQADTKRAEESFTAWKTQKDLDIRLQRLNTSDDKHTPQLSDMTPSLPGYCSVWSCDQQLANVITNKVPRGEPVILSTNHIAVNEKQKT